jgi:hypothetical protein
MPSRSKSAIVRSGVLLAERHIRELARGTAGQRGWPGRSLHGAMIFRCDISGAIRMACSAKDPTSANIVIPAWPAGAAGFGQLG